MQEHEDVLAAMARLQQLVRETEDYRRRLTASASMRMTRCGSALASACCAMLCHDAAQPGKGGRLHHQQLSSASCFRS